MATSRLVRPNSGYSLPIVTGFDKESDGARGRFTSV